MKHTARIRPRTLSVSAAALLVLAGCATPSAQKEVNADYQKSLHAVANVKKQLPIDQAQTGSAAEGERLAKAQRNAPVLRHSSKVWVGNHLVPVNADDRLPALFRAHYLMNFSDAGRPADLSTVAARLSELVNMPVNIAPDVLGSLGLGAPGGAVRQMPAVSVSAAAKPDAIRMRWEGTLTGFLNDLTTRLGLSWEYRDNSIVIMRYVTRVYEIASYPNGFDYAMSSGATGSQSSEGTSSSSSMTISESGKLNGMTSLLDILEEMVDVVPGSTVSVADGSGRVIVRTSKAMQSQVREFIRAENKNMLKQVHIQIDLYSVRTTQDEQQGVNWNALYRSLSNNLDIDLASPANLVGNNAGSVRFTVPTGATAGDTGSRFGNSTAIVQALSEFGQSVQYRPISLIALNRQWARKARLNTTGYLSETTPASGGVLGGSSALPGLKTDTITTGDQFAVMPYVLENNTVMLKMGVSLSNLISLFEVTTGDGATLQRVQTPNTSSISDQYTISLNPGEVMAVTGLSREVSQNNSRRLAEGASIATGGSDATNAVREHFVVFIRAVIV